jgi:gliding motility-associated-like protein
LNSTTVFYADPFEPGCPNAIRTPVTATINEIPVLNVTSPQPICYGNQGTINANTTAGTIYWYDLATGGNSIGTGNSFTTQPLTGNFTLYAEAINNGCSSGSRIPVSITVNPNPILDQDLTIDDCVTNPVTLDAGISGMVYNWSTGETSQSVIINSQNQYYVVVTDQNNCSSTRNYDVILHNAPEITDVTISDNSATITTVENGEYEFSTNGSDFQMSNIFYHLPGGNYTATVREINGCGEDTMPFWIIDCPSFFTPNGDGFNDFWKVEGIELYPEASVEIFDRYGKLITILNATNTSWNGTFNNKLLPSDDYWFIFRASNNAKTIKGHFALKR